MPNEYTLPSGQKVRTGPFSINGYQFPTNWFDLASASDLTNWGITVASVTDPAPTSWTVARTTIIDRLQTAGKMAAAKTALGASSAYQQERWYATQRFLNNDSALVTLLNGISADPNTILAIEA